jgi:hypothetical protein
VACLEARALLREASDHRPIVVSLSAESHVRTADEEIAVSVVA